MSVYTEEDFKARAKAGVALVPTPPLASFVTPPLRPVLRRQQRSPPHSALLRRNLRLVIRVTMRSAPCNRKLRRWRVTQLL